MPPPASSAGGRAGRRAAQAYGKSAGAVERASGADRPRPGEPGKGPAARMRPRRRNAVRQRLRRAGAAEVPALAEVDREGAQRGVLGGGLDALRDDLDVAAVG